MSLNRREFMGMALGAGVYAKGTRFPRPESVVGAEKPKVGFSILQGMTDEESAQFSLVLPRAESWAVSIVDSAQRSLPFESRLVGRDFSDFVVHKIFVSGLRLGQEYRLIVKDSQGNERDERGFRALDLSARQVKLAFASCACDFLHHDDVWERMEAEAPEMAFFLGDNVYADRPGFWTVRLADPEQLWRRYVQTRNRVAFYFRKNLIPVLAIWDDHDFGGNNQGRAYAFKDQSRETFETFFAQSARPRLSAGPGIAKRFSAFGADFYLLDGRSFRDPWDESDSRMFGVTQEKWLVSGIGERLSWLINGSVFFGAYNGKDSYEGHYTNDFRRFLQRLKKTDGTFCFASGDVHYSELMDIEAEPLGYKTFEMISSSIHSYTFPGHEWRFKNARRRTATSAHNFTVFQGVFNARGLEGEVASFSASDTEFRETLRVRR
jgi:hypothetical protein